MTARCMPADPPGLAGEPLTLAHRAMIETLLERLAAPLSEYSFANLYLFRAVHRYRLCTDPLPHLLGVTYDGVPHAMPLVPFGARDAETLLARAACLYPIAEQTDAAALGLLARWNEDDSDYVYDAPRLARLDGPKLKPKRSQAAVFEAMVQPRAVLFGPEHRAPAQEVLALWARQVDRAREDTDYEACREALIRQEQLGLSGLMVFDGAGGPCAFLLARPLGQGGVAVHFAKGNRDYAGVYPYMFSRYAALSGAAWLNFEQDLGSPGLRQAKRALDPIRRLRKLRLSRRTP